MPYNLRIKRLIDNTPRYNGYRVERNEDGTYSVVNDSPYGTEFDTSRTMYYTQRNEGKFIIVETRAPSGYYGDWTDVEQPARQARRWASALTTSRLRKKTTAA